MAKWQKQHNINTIAKWQKQHNINTTAKFKRLERPKRGCAIAEVAKLIGKIILAEFLEYTLERFVNFIAGLEELPLYQKLSYEGIITRRYLPDAKIAREERFPSGVIAEVKNDGSFSIHYSNAGFSIEYMVDNEKLQRIISGGKLTEEDKKDISRLLHKLRRINTRNLITHEVLKGILHCQRDYFESNNELGLKPLRRAELARAILKENSGGIVTDISRISRVIRGISIITPLGKEVALRSLFPTKRDVIKRRIRVLLSSEREDMYGGRLKVPYTDEQIRRKLSDEHNISITRREVAYCRKGLGILPYSKRVNSHGYPPLTVNFSPIYPFTIPSVKNNAPKCPGIYELRLDNAKIDYPKGSCEIFYIGSGGNLRKRLFSHLSPSSGNGGINKFIQEKGCAFRYVQVPQGWEGQEKRFFNLFTDTFGDSPLCNRISPKEASKIRGGGAYAG